MSKVVRVSDIYIDRLEEYRNSRIERAKLLISTCPSYQVDIERYKELSYPELVEDCIISALVNSESDVKNLSECLK